jgi:prepilin-type N-terminal cleavage/methylation domain-containing protein/prepilin-type processing-associated H-X9-DG protein
MNNVKREGAGFTFVELLVVVAVIGILACLLLTSLSRAQGSGRAVKCTSNLRQIALGISIYVGDNGSYPLFRSPAQTPAPAFWFIQIEPYLKSTWSNEVFHCPGYRGVTYSGVSGVSGEMIAAPSGSYAYNVDGERYIGQINLDLQSVKMNSLGLGGVYTGNAARPQIACSEMRVRNPAEMIELTDSIQTSIAGGSLKPPEFRSWPWACPSLWSLMPDPFKTAGRKADEKRHNERSMVAFCDGHMERIKSAVLFSKNPTILSRWNSDNQPHLELTQFF